MLSTTLDHDAVAPYLDEIRRYPLLSREQELRLARLCDRGDATAKRRLIECNLRLVVVIARRYRGLGLDLLDLVQEGNVGLMAAAERYDWRRDVRFATYASCWIRREICRALSTKSRLIRLPVRVADSATSVKQAERTLIQRLGRRASCEEVAREAGVDENTVAVLRQAALTTVSLASQREEDGARLEELLSDQGGGDPAQLLADGADPTDAIAALQSVGGRARRVLELRHGLDGAPARSLSEVARELGVSRERARQLEKLALLGLARRHAPGSLHQAA